EIGQVDRPAVVRGQRRVRVEVRNVAVARETAPDGLLARAARRGHHLISTRVEGEVGRMHRYGRGPGRTLDALRPLDPLRPRGARVALVALRSRHRPGVLPRATRPDPEIPTDQVRVARVGGRRKVGLRADGAVDLQTRADVALLALIALRAL